jgi:myosin heavy subunit
MDVSASTSLQSLDSSLETQRRASVESASAEAEALKRKLSLCRKAQSEIGDVRRERDQFRETNDRSERRIGQLKDIVRKSKDNEKALKNKIHGLEDALLAANMERVDVLEGYHEACEQIRKLHDKQLMMIKERNEAAAHSIPPEFDGRGATFASDNSASHAGLNGVDPEKDAMFLQLDELRALISEKESQLRSIESEHRNSVSKLELFKLEKRLASAEADRDQYNALLHAELRRQSKIAASNGHAATPHIGDGAAAAVAEKLKSKPGIENTEKRCEFLEKELKHCFQEIILYKLDIRGYRKDLKEANCRIDTFQMSRSRRPETPDSMDNHAADDKPASPGRRRRATSGLGISLQHPSTPTRPTTTSLATPQQKNCAIATPSFSARTPLELHKKLPRPPSSSREPSPCIASSPPVTTLTRAETLRSLSESIISSYAKRATPEQYHGDVPVLVRGRSSDPPRTGGLMVESRRAIEAIAVPISRYTSDMLKTPSMTAIGVAKT